MGRAAQLMRISDAQNAELAAQQVNIQPQSPAYNQQMSESYYIRQKVAAASERGRRMANRRWQLDRQRRDRLAALTAEQCPAEIVRRIIVIEHERDVKEAVFWNWESGRDRRRKLKAIL